LVSLPSGLSKAAAASWSRWMPKAESSITAAEGAQLFHFW